MFKDRQEAGELLVQQLEEIIVDRDFLVVALLRGGIVLGKRVSDYFKIPLIPLAVKKIGAPLDPELAIGAIGPKNSVYWDEKLCRDLGLTEKEKKEELEKKKKEQQELEQRLRIKHWDFTDRRIILVDDGIATGATVLAAQKFLKKEKAKEIILAIPVIAKESLNNIKTYFDRIVSIKIADQLTSVSQFYKEFPQVSDEEAMSYLV